MSPFEQAAFMPGDIGPTSFFKKRCVVPCWMVWLIGCVTNGKELRCDN